MTDALFRHLLESTFFCLFVGSLTYCLRRQAASVRHSVWLISTLKFAVPTALLAAAGAHIAYVLPASAWISSVAAKLLALSAYLIRISAIGIHAGDETFLSFALLAIWIFGSIMMFSSWFTRLRQSYHRGSVAQIGEGAALHRAKRRMGFRGAVALRCSEGQIGPALAGVFRPFIVVPQGLSAQLTAEEFEAVLMHELAHAHRRDNLASAFVHCLLCIFWFHPLLWFVEKRILAESERACDETVTDRGMDAKIYLAGLVKVCRFHLLGSVAGVSAVNGSDLGTRFDRILSRRASKPIPNIVRFIVAAVALFTTVLPIAGGYCEQCVSSGRGMISPGVKGYPSSLQIRKF